MVSKLKKNMLTNTHLHSCVYGLANMLQIGTHKDHNMPSDVSMLGGDKRRCEKHSEVVDALSGIAEGIVSSISVESLQPPLVLLIVYCCMYLA